MFNTYTQKIQPKKECLKFVYKNKHKTKQTNKKNYIIGEPPQIPGQEDSILLWSQFLEFDHRFTAMQINILSLLSCSNYKANSKRQMGIQTAKVTLKNKIMGIILCIFKAYFQCRILQKLW